jgi:uncharacterized protein YabN with tetrapyrrole methylase and pyrophosphatase domain
MNKKFQDVRNWGAIRGLNKSTFQRQFQKCLQEMVEIHDAYNNDDIDEISDAIGDTIITLINLGKIKDVDMNSEDCLDDAFGVIEYRKGLNIDGDFIRYHKLNIENKNICDKKQGSVGNEYFTKEMKPKLTVKSFKK